MTEFRKPEFEEAMDSAPRFPRPANDLVSGLKASVRESADTFRDFVVQAPPTAGLPYRLLVVDDNQGFLKSLNAAASGLNLNIEGLNPATANEVKDRILAAFREDKGFDHVLIDFQYVGKHFNGLDILRLLRPPGNPDERFKMMREKDQLRMFYLPVAIVTRGGSLIDNPYFDEEALGAGADNVFAEKGYGGEVDPANGAPAFEEHYTARPLLESLRKNGFKEMRFRAWTRLWQDLHDVLENEIRSQLTQSRWVKDGTVEEPLKRVWDALALPLITTGYAAHLTMRIFPRTARVGDATCAQPDQPWILNRIGSTDDPEHCPANIAWDAIPMLKQCLTREIYGIGIDEHLTTEDLNCDQPNLNPYRSYLGRRAMVARLEAEGVKVGTFIITRNASDPPFFKEDAQHLKVIVVRLGLFFRQLKTRLINHKRQIDLTQLGEQLMEQDTENEIVDSAVHSLHEHLHQSRDEFTPNPADNPALGGRVTLRLIAPGTTGFVRPDPNIGNPEDGPSYLWTLGFDSSQSPKQIPSDSSERYWKLYSDVITSGVSLFYPESSTARHAYKRKSTLSRMLVPIKAGNVVVGTIDVEHRHVGFYGTDEATSADFALVKAIALEVGQALRSLRARRMHRDLLKLHEATGRDQDERVIDGLVRILYGYTGCAVALWVETKGEEWQVTRVWECPQTFPEDAHRRFNPDQIREEPPKRVDDWHQHVTSSFDQTLIGQVVHAQQPGLAYYTENRDEFTNDSDMGIDTRAQAVLALRDPESEHQALLGIFVLLFNQQPALDEEAQRPVLEDAARFGASYLAIRRKNREFLANSQITQQQAAVGQAYQQLRHSLIIQLGGANGLLDRLSSRLDKMDLPGTDARSQVDELVGKPRSLT